MADNETTIVDFAAMGEAISNYKQKVTAIQGIMQAMQGIQTALQAANIFTGGAASSMIATIGSYIKALEGAMGSLNGVVKLLEDKMQKYDAADKAASEIANNVETAQWSEV